MAYRHDQWVRAWLDGKRIQYSDGDAWIDLLPPEAANKMPHFYVTREYRFAPRTIRMRHALMKDGSIVLVTNLLEEAKLASDRNIDMWIDDWNEVVLS